MVEVNALEGGSTEKSSRSVVKDSIAEEDAIVQTVVGSTTFTGARHSVSEDTL